MTKTVIFGLGTCVLLAVLAGGCGGETGDRDGLGTGGAGAESDAAAMSGGSPGTDAGTDAAGGTTNAGTGGRSQGGSGGSASTVDCESACRRTEDVGCPNARPVDACVTDCDVLVKECGPEFAAIERCAQAGGSIMCDEDGEPRLLGCDTEAEPLFACAACLRVPSDDACQVCLKTECCDERTALSGDPAVAALNTCLEGCDDVACNRGCFEQYPEVEAALAAALECSGQCPCQ